VLKLPVSGAKIKVKKISCLFVAIEKLGKKETQHLLLLNRSVLEFSI